MTGIPTTSPYAFAGWSEDRIDELDANHDNGHVGNRLISETDHVRVWHLNIPPRVRFGFHAYVLNYLWTALADGSSRSHYPNGSIRDVTYKAGDTKHLSFAAGDGMQHDLENTGDTELVFVTVEYKDRPNAPLPL